MPAPTLTRYLLGVGRAPDQQDHARILSAVAVAMKITAAAVSRGPLIVQGHTKAPAPTASEYKRALRHSATDVLLSQVADLPELAAVSVAGRPHINQVSTGGRFLLLVDAMHGLGNLDDNLSVGATFSLLQLEPRQTEITAGDFCQPGSQQVCAGLVLFGPRTLLVLTTGAGVQGFTLDREVGNFVLTHPDMQIPGGAHVLTINASEAKFWPAPVRRFVDECLLGADGPRGHQYVMRWNASAVVGVFRMLNSGGIFLVPPTERPQTWLAPLLYTAAPMAFLAEQAGGTATTGTARLLDRVPTALDERVPMYLGETVEVERLIGYIDDHEKGLDAEVAYPLFHHRSLFID
ncbi:MAG: class 1 fructose-bisphosphatase [Brooklawnia sp.]|uniref:hypothetical protein n=1 Tax=Brooklawnia sp. TaxID=2699740 RepID=UPI003C738D1A